MKNYLKFLISSKILVKVSGNNVNRFIKRLKNNNIDLISVSCIEDSLAYIKIYVKDLEKLIDLKTIYELEIIKYYGWSKLKNNIFNNKFMILFILIFTIFLYVISNVIFEVDIYTNDYKMKEKLILELEENGIKKYKFKKSYSELQIIKSKILNKYKNELEWIEIESNGTKYLIKYEPRIINKDEDNPKFRNIVAKKDAVITSVDISTGQIVKGVNSYVKKGDVIVSGYIRLNDSIKDVVAAKGIVLGETWYKVNITYPLTYYENYETGNSKNVFVIKLLNNEYELFNFNKYKTKNKKNYVLLKNNLLPISFVKQNQRQTKIINEKNTEKSAINRALECSKSKIEEKLKEKEYIKDYKILNLTRNDNSITLDVFFTIVEDITEYEEIDSNYETIDE